MAKTDKTFKYLYKLPANIYNNNNPYYQLTPLPNSNVIEGYFFSGKNEVSGEKNPIVCLFLESKNEFSRKTQFYNLQRLLNLVYLETGTPTYYQRISIPQDSTLESIFSEYGDENCYHPKVSFHGSANKPGHIARAVHLGKIWSSLNKKTFEKFDNALNTYVWALEIMELPNPDLKYTLYMTLLLSSINQLTKGSELCSNHWTCEKCKKDVRHQVTSEKKAIETLMTDLLDGESLEDGIRKFKKLYSKLRSEFLHSGKLYGGEKDGGFLSNFEYPGELSLNQMDLIITCRQLLEQFLIKGQNKNDK